jgi:hypothetical protein
MNRWLGFIIAVLAVIGAFIAGQKMKPLSDVNPVGFHVRGQVQVNGNTLDASKCTANPIKPCTLGFDFALSEKSTPTAQSCDPGSNCLSYSNQQGNTLTVTVYDSSTGNGTVYNDYVNGRVVVTQ